MFKTLYQEEHLLYSLQEKIHDLKCRIYTYLVYAIQFMLWKILKPKQNNIAKTSLQKIFTNYPDSEAINELQSPEISINYFSQLNSYDQSRGNIPNINTLILSY